MLNIFCKKKADQKQNMTGKSLYPGQCQTDILSQQSFLVVYLHTFNTNSFLKSLNAKTRRGSLVGNKTCWCTGKEGPKWVSVLTKFAAISQGKTESCMPEAPCLPQEITDTKILIVQNVKFPQKGNLYNNQHGTYQKFLHFIKSFKIR